MSDVEVRRVNATCIITLTRPGARNALTFGALRTLSAALEDASTDSTVRCVVLTGSGGHFCSGADLRQNILDDPDIFDHLDTAMDSFHALVKSLVRCEKPTVAAMDGAAVGFGADLAFGCDLRIATTRAYAQEKFVNIGLMPDGGGSFWLPRLVGTARAMQWILLGDRIEAAQLYDLGIVMEVVAPEALEDATRAVAARLEAGPPRAYAAIKRAVYANWGSLEDALRREREEQIRLLASADFKEGIAAWVEKRAPRFEGR